MSNIKVINTSTIRSNINELENHRKYYSIKTSAFSSGTFGYSYELSNYLKKIKMWIQVWGLKELQQYWKV